MDIGAAFDEARIHHQIAVQRDIGFDAFDQRFAQRRAHARHGLLAGVAVNDELGNHRVVVGRYAVVGVKVAVHPHARPARRVPQGDAARRGCEFVGVFGVDAALERMAAHGDVALAERQLLTGGHHDLRAHDVNARDPLCQRMFHLHAGVHLDEIELAVFVQKLESARIAIADFLAGAHAAVANALNQATRNARCRRLFNHLLVAALHGAVAFAQKNGILVIVGDDLNLDMARVLQEFFHVHRRIAKRRAGFGARHGNGVEQRSFGMHHAHAASAAAASSLDDDRIADLFGDALELSGVFGQFAIRAGHAGHAGLDHGLFGRYLVAHDADGIGCWADEGEAAFFHALGKIGVFGQKAVAGVNGFGICYLGSRNNGRHIEIALRRRCRPDTDGFVGELDVFGVAIGFGINHDRLDAHFLAGTLDAQGDFTPVGYQYFLEHKEDPAIQPVCRVWMRRCARAMTPTQGASRLFDHEQRLAKFHRVAVIDQNLLHGASGFGFDFVEDFHGLDDA